MLTSESKIVKNDIACNSDFEMFFDFVTLNLQHQLVDKLPGKFWFLFH